MVDRLDALLAHFPVHAQVFQAGALCGINELDDGEGLGHLHLIRNGAVEVLHGGITAARINQPSLLFYPGPLAHRFVTDPEQGADFVCARLRFEGGRDNPVVSALPPFLCLPLATVEGMGEVLSLLFDEAFNRYCGRQAMLDRLFEVALIKILRHLMEQGQAQAGMLAGMSHPRLRFALVAMHETPQQDWSLEALAARAGMSRSVFANAFRNTIGCTPGAYLQGWRIRLAQRLLRQGRALKWVADEVGYGSEAALSRAFKAQTGLSPRAWGKCEAGEERAGDSLR